MNRYPSLRDYLEALRDLGELVEVNREVDWNLEMGAISRLIYETGSPAALFTSIRDSAPGFRALTAPVGTSAVPGRRLCRIALTLGLDADESASGIIEAIVAARGRDPIPPVRVETGPCKQNILLGDDVDLTSLPLPLLHDGDGGRFLNTLGVIVVKSPDGRWTNWSVARVQLLDERRATGVVVPFQHIGQVHAQWRKAGRDMPFALALGVEPMVLFAGGSPLPRDVDEVDFIGAYYGEPVRVVKCETNELEVPATSEIVIEGRVSITDLALEGPYGDYGGYMYPDAPAPEPVFYIDAMTHQDNPIFPFTSSGEPADETHTIIGTGFVAETVFTLREAGLPVARAWSPFESACGWLAITVNDEWREFEPDGNKLSRLIAETAIGMRGHGHPVNTFVVIEDDIDPANLAELVWGLNGRSDSRPGNEIYIEGVLNWPTTPYIMPAIGDYPQGWMNPRRVHNCLPAPGVTRPGRTGFKHNVPEALQKQVLANWGTDGFPAIPGEQR